MNRRDVNRKDVKKKKHEKFYMKKGLSMSDAGCLHELWADSQRHHFELLFVEDLFDSDVNKFKLFKTSRWLREAFMTRFCRWI